MQQVCDAKNEGEMKGNGVDTTLLGRPIGLRTIIIFIHVYAILKMQ